MNPRAGLAIVTGASSGIGYELALQLSGQGRPVLAVARRADRLEQLRQGALSAKSAPIEALAVDLTEPGAAQRVASRADELGGAGWLVNDAGTLTFGPFSTVDVESSVRVVRLNCESLVALTAAVLPTMLARRRGVVLNIASVAGFMPTPLMAVYGGSKAFVISYSAALAQELRGSGVTVSVVCPGPVKTEIYDVAAPGVERVTAPGEMSAEACASYALAAAERGAGVVVPGLLNKLNVLSAHLAPRALVQRILWARGLSYLGYQRSKFKRLP